MRWFRQSFMFSHFPIVRPSLTRRSWRPEDNKVTSNFGNGCIYHRSFCLVVNQIILKSFFEQLCSVVYHTILLGMVSFPLFRLRPVVWVNEDCRGVLSLAKKKKKNASILSFIYHLERIKLGFCVEQSAKATWSAEAMDHLSSNNTTTHPILFPTKSKVSLSQKQSNHTDVTRNGSTHY